jgi:hypothetical protein
MVFVQSKIHVPYQEWVIEMDTDGKFLIRNVFHNKSYLHPGGTGGHGDMAIVTKQLHVPYH